MKIFILAGLAAALFATAVSARNPAPKASGSSDRDPALQRAAAGLGDRKRLALETRENLTPDPGNTAPQVTFAFFDPASGNEAMSPADGSALEEMGTWQLQILDRNGGKVDFRQGRGRPPAAALSWSGLSETGEQFPSGFYAARFVWRDTSGEVHATQKVSFNIFSRLKVPQFAELKLQFRFAEDLSLL